MTQTATTATVPANYLKAAHVVAIQTGSTVREVLQASFDMAATDADADRAAAALAMFA